VILCNVCNANGKPRILGVVLLDLVSPIPREGPMWCIPM
jgi:hypothetical protein